MTKSNNLLADYAAKKQDICIKNDTISDSLFREYGVNRGLRDVNGKGVLTGLTNISEIVSFKTGEDGSSVPCDGQLWYRGYNVKTLTNNLRPGEFGFEKIAYIWNAGHFHLSYLRFLSYHRVVSRIRQGYQCE
ncbi:hypothetical protein [Agathobacter rectalis]|uniref:hypothetical protein n=1 Tax=Agathobacter rectalis TaxID=39491 RepID=UPI003D17CCC3